jgi:hypothetical protein
MATAGLLLFFGGLVKQLLRMIVISVSVAAVITAVLHLSFTGITIAPKIPLRALPTTRDVALNALIALSACAAASLALVTLPQIIETTPGASRRRNHRRRDRDRARSGRRGDRHRIGARTARIES